MRLMSPHEFNNAKRLHQILSLSYSLLIGVKAKEKRTHKWQTICYLN